VNRVIESNSRRLAGVVSRRLASVFTPANGARSGWDGVLPRRLVRVSNYYGFRRTRARARIIVEVGAAGADDRFLRRTNLIAANLSVAIRLYLRDRPGASARSGRGESAARNRGGVAIVPGRPRLKRATLHG
jgi:subtilisin family serine protease